MYVFYWISFDFFSYVEELKRFDDARNNNIQNAKYRSFDPNIFHTLPLFVFWTDWTRDEFQTLWLEKNGWTESIKLDDIDGRTRTDPPLSHCEHYEFTSSTTGAQFIFISGTSPNFKAKGKLKKKRLSTLPHYFSIEIKEAKKENLS